MHGLRRRRCARILHALSRRAPRGHGKAGRGESPWPRTPQVRAGPPQQGCAGARRCPCRTQLHAAPMAQCRTLGRFRSGILGKRSRPRPRARRPMLRSWQVNSGAERAHPRARAYVHAPWRCHSLRKGWAIQCALPAGAWPHLHAEDELAVVLLVTAHVRHKGARGLLHDVAVRLGRGAQRSRHGGLQAAAARKRHGSAA
jgi:hypothetical protein